MCSVQLSHSVLSDSATPWTAAYQAPPSMGFSKQEYWSGVSLPSRLCMLKSPLTKYAAAASAAKLLQSCSTLCDPLDGSLPGSPVPGILQARTLEKERKLSADELMLLNCGVGEDS